MKKQGYFKLVLCLLLLGSRIGLSQRVDIPGPAGSGSFGSTVSVLPNGNYIVCDPYFDDGPNFDAGAVYLYNGLDHSLISRLTGSSSNDRVGAGGITILANGNYVVRSPNWNNQGVANTGAVTWGSAATGVSGVVTSQNSLVGSKAGDLVGLNPVTALANGNYVVLTANWHNALNYTAGAVTLGNGSTGTGGPVNSINSLVGGNTEGSRIGDEIVALPNGNYIVISQWWDNGPAQNAGAVTWGNGTTGTTGQVTSLNSLIGTNTNDYVGAGGIKILANGNYLVCSPHWNNGAISKAGAVTWGNGSSGVSGPVTGSNSLVGTHPSDFVGQSGVVVLSNGNYAVGTPTWDNGGTEDAGAATWGNGVTGVSGAINSTNSLIGQTTNNRVGREIVALTNGNYVIGSAYQTGAVTWSSGTSGITGVVSNANSFAGNPGDNVGSRIYALTNGNYVICSPGWNSSRGAVTWGNGETGIVGSPNIANSLVGGFAYSMIGLGGVTVLSNGNYVIKSPDWDNGSEQNAGAATWGNGATGTIGVVTSGNSLVGIRAGDQVGLYITALTNGNYVVGSPYWDYGTVTDAGAATWGNGETGISGTLSLGNSLIGSTVNDNIGLNVTPLTNGNYTVNSPTWDNGAVNDAGAVTWGNGTTGVAGLVNSSNSLVDINADDQAGFIEVWALPNGDYVVANYYLFNDPYYAAGVATLGDGWNGTRGPISGCNSIFGGVANSYAGFVKAYNEVYNYLILGLPAENRIVISNLNGMALGNSLDESAVNIAGGDIVPIVANGACRILATIASNGSQPVTGEVKAKVWVENGIPTVNDRPFVARHYEITPTVNAANATGRVTLYFTDADFTAFNGHSGRIADLPTSATGDADKGNLRIGKYAGESTDGTGLPGSYTGGSSVIDPADEDIVWNSAFQRWEVSFAVTGFSGFIVQTDLNPLPVAIAKLTVVPVENKTALLQWVTTSETNSDRFDVEHSPDATSWQKTGSVYAKGESTGLVRYNYLHVSPSPGNNYYRLKQIDKDGAFAYSSIVSVRFTDTENQAFFYPNPVSDRLFLRGNNDIVKLEVLNLSGQTILESSGDLAEGIPLRGINTGIYLIRLLERNGKSTTAKVVVQK